MSLRKRVYDILDPSHRQGVLILGAGFVEEYQKRFGRSRRCPHCGKEIDQKD